MCTAPRIWCSFFGLVMWIAIYIYLCPDLLHYMDDAWSYKMDLTLVYYKPYDLWFPHKQVKLLLLYNELGLPHVKKKQVFGWSLEIIGLYVNPIDMTINMSDRSHNNLITTIQAFVDTSQSRRHPVIKWQRILRWINWGLNAYPLVHPTLQPAYTKITGKHISCARLYLNWSVIQNFLWLADTIEASEGIHILNSIEWGHLDSNLVIYSDASLTGLGFEIPLHHLGFCTSTPSECLVTTIFYYEALAITSVVLWASGLSPKINHLLVYTNSLNCVNMFNTLSTQEGYNDILLFTVCILISLNISLCVFHIPGHDNTVADACYVP